ncbi:MAG: hypothetical protein Q9211_006297, partial [Gyalolechia sp. 1 TL-2023]
MRQSKETQFPGAAAQARQYHPGHLGGYCPSVGDDAEGVRDQVDEVGGDQFHEEGGDYVGEEDERFGDRGTDEVEGGGEDDYIQDVVDET